MFTTSKRKKHAGTRSLSVVLRQPVSLHFNICTQGKLCTLAVAILYLHFKEPHKKYMFYSISCTQKQGEGYGTK